MNEEAEEEEVQVQQKIEGELHKLQMTAKVDHDSWGTWLEKIT